MAKPTMVRITPVNAAWALDRASQAGHSFQAFINALVQRERLTGGVRAEPDTREGYTSAFAELTRGAWVVLVYEGPHRDVFVVAGELADDPGPSVVNVVPSGAEVTLPVPRSRIVAWEALGAKDRAAEVRDAVERWRRFGAREQPLLQAL